MNHGKSRDIGYCFAGEFSESDAEAILSKAKARGVVTEYDTGRGRIVWFNGHPGPELRAVRDAIRHVVES